MLTRANSFRTVHFSFGLVEPEVREFGHVEKASRWQELPVQRLREGPEHSEQPKASPAEHS